MLWWRESHQVIVGEPPPGSGFRYGLNVSWYHGLKVVLKLRPTWYLKCRIRLYVGGVDHLTLAFRNAIGKPSLPARRDPYQFAPGLWLVINQDGHGERGLIWNPSWRLGLRRCRHGVRIGGESCALVIDWWLGFAWAAKRPDGRVTVRELLAWPWTYWRVR